MNAKNDFEALPLHYAQTPEMIIILVSDESVNKYNSMGYTPLHKAIELDKPDNVQTLINHGADVFAKSFWDTPLDFANANDGASEEIIEILTKAMANADKKNKI